MMIKWKNLLVSFWVVMSIWTVKAQQWCATNELMQRYWNTSMFNHKQALDDHYMQVYPNLLNSFMSTPVDTIHLVVHVIHKGEPIGQGSNLPDSLIKRVIKYVSDLYRARGYPNSVDMGLEFVLACQDPSGNPTTGIIRVNGSSIPNYANDGVNCNGTVSFTDVVNLSPQWDPSKYINIYVVHSISCGNIAGFSFLPNGSIDIYDVVFMDASSFNVGVLAHEIGHYLDLYHTFEGGSSTACPPVANGCGNGLGDCCNDTPPHKTWDCDGTNDCSSAGIWDNSRNNVMSYCFHDERFTNDQRLRVQFALQNLGDRSGLLAYNPGCTPSAPPSVSGPDLVAVNFTIDSISNNKVYGYVFVHNQGDVNAGPFDIVVRAAWGVGPSGGSCILHIDTVNVSGLVAGGYLSALYVGNLCNPDTCVLTDSAYTLYKVDYSNTVAEVNENNNFIGYGYVPPPSCSPSSGCGSLTASFQFNPSCDSVTITANPSGGQPPYTYTWISIGINYGATLGTTQTVTVVAGDTIRVYIYDSNNCLFDTTLIIPVGSGSVSLNIDSIKHVSCNGNNDGAIYLSATGGSTPYQYTWSPTTPPNITSLAPGNASIMASPLGPGTWQVAVSDASGCSSQTISFTITEPAPITTNSFIVTPSCNGDSTGRIYVSVGGGTQPYSFLWSTGDTTQNLYPVPAGTYILTITDANGCTHVDTFTVTQPAPLITTISTNSAGDSLIATTTGGTPPYQYVWSTGATTPAIYVPSSGTYWVITVDANMCSRTDTITVTVSSMLTTQGGSLECIPITKNSHLLITCNDPATQVEAKLFTIDGRMILSNTFTGVMEFNNSNLPYGTYILELRTTDYSKQSHAKRSLIIISPTK